MNGAAIGLWIDLIRSNDRSLIAGPSPPNTKSASAVVRSTFDGLSLSLMHSRGGDGASGERGNVMWRRSDGAM